QGKKWELKSEIVFFGVTLFDQFLTQGFFRSKRMLQVLGIACLTIVAAKMEIPKEILLRQTKFHVGSYSYEWYDVCAMELLVKRFPSNVRFANLLCTNHFIGLYLKAAKVNKSVENKVMYLPMLTFWDNNCLSSRPSTVAFHLLVLGTLATHQDCCWSSDLSYITGFPVPYPLDTTVLDKALGIYQRRMMSLHQGAYMFRSSPR
ncbi:hypothetical protein GIB67_011046, partial [Kingdonia uniflora]